jgi:hypothetical protein
LETATNKTIPKKHISESIQLEFQNNSNLKYDIQNRSIIDAENNFINALKNMAGDNFNPNSIGFSEITRLAMAYFYTEIFKHKIEDSFYTLSMVKGFLDGNNLSNYTAIYEYDVVYYNLERTEFFRHCWLIIQAAWFFNSEFFGSHQHLEYLCHYLETGEKLCIKNYQYDKEYLEKKYSEIENQKLNNFTIQRNTFINQWYFYILFLICNELKISTKNFKISTKDNREFNPITKTSRQLRPITPFKVNECDIKSAFPSFIDTFIGSNLKDKVYNNLMLIKGITRGQAKIIFNKYCNSGKYHSKEETADFFQNCGYSKAQSEQILLLTHDLNKKFYSFMTNYEYKAINKFVLANDLVRGSRLHDAVIFIDDKTKPILLRNNTKVEFGFKHLNNPKYQESFSLSRSKIAYAYVSSITQNLELITKIEFQKPSVKGEALGFKFYSNNYNYVSAAFNLQFPWTNDLFEMQVNTMFATIFKLNSDILSPRYIYIILSHIRAKSNVIFNVRALYRRILKTNFKDFKVPIKQRDFNFTESHNFKTKIEFLNELNKSRGIVNTNANYYNLFCILEERICNNDYAYLDEVKIIGKRKNNLLAFSVIRVFNLLATGNIRKPRKVVKSYPLSKEYIKRVTLNSKNNCKVSCRSNLNHIKIEQLYLILTEILQLDSNIDVKKDTLVQDELKLQLTKMIVGTNNYTLETAVEFFNNNYLPTKTVKVPLNFKLDGIFNEDLSNSIFNNIDIKDASCMGEIFFLEYQKFHGLNEKEKFIYSPIKVLYKNPMPEIDFDV